MNKVPRGLQKGSSEIEEAEVDEVPNGLQDDHWIQVIFHFSNRKFDEAIGAERWRDATTAGYYSFLEEREVVYDG